MPEMLTAAHWWRESSEVFNKCQAPPPAQPEGKLLNTNSTSKTLKLCYSIDFHMILLLFHKIGSMLSIEPKNNGLGIKTSQLRKSL